MLTLQARRVEVRPKVAAAMALQPIDAWDLLVWAYHDQRADRLLGGGAGLLEAERLASGARVTRASADGCVTLARGAGGASLVGTGFVDVGVPVDAELVHEEMQRLARSRTAWHVRGPGRQYPLGAVMAGIVLDHARGGMVPTWRTQRLVPVKGRRGAPRVDLSPDRRHGTCPLVPSPSDAEIAYERRIYGLWWNGVAAIARTLRWRSTLTAHRITGFSAPKRPWVVGSLHLRPKD